MTRIGGTTRRIVLGAGLLFVAGRLAAQGPPITRELRVDGLMSAHAAIEVGASAIIPAGIYSRTSVTAATGVVRRNATDARVARFEMVSRFLLDPYRESPYGLSVGGGLGMTNSAGGPQWRPYLALVLDLELERAHGLTPALQLGLGGGARLGVALRSGNDRWR